MSDPSEWEIPSRPDDWSRIEPVDPEEGRKLARWLRWSAGAWARSGRPELARKHEQFADAMLAEAEAVENDDYEGWLAAIDAQGRAGL